MKILITTLSITFASLLVRAEPTINLHNYDHYQLWVDCSERAAIAFKYTVSKDLGNKKRYHSFYDDLSVKQECKQKKRSSYSHYNSDKPKYDRGHLAAANHFDFDKDALKQANIMTNVLPQTLQLNRGAWKRTEELIECYRDRFPVNTVGGVIWGTDSSNDLFFTSHGIRTPDYFWRIHWGKLDSQSYMSAWVMPNTEDARASNLKNYRVDIDSLVQLLEYPQLKKLLFELRIQSGKPFKYSKGCKLHES